MATTLYSMWAFVLVVLVLVWSTGQANGAAENSMAKRRAEKMIRQLNLFPLHDLNRGPSGHSPAGADSPRLVEKKFKLNLLGDSGASVEDLGHHAGYYRLPNTVDARSSSRLTQEYAKNDFFITGESYAGHYIPALGSRVNQGNKKKEGIPINLKGLAIGNGITNPELHVGGSACGEANNRCETIFNQILGIADNINYYDIRRKCDGGSLCYNFSNVETLLNTQSVKDALGVGKDIEFVSCSTEVYRAMASDEFKNLAVGIPSLLEDGINLLVYAGEYDLICNWLDRNWRWVEALKWSGQGGFGAAPNVTFSVDGKENGIQKSYGPLTFLKVHDAGHLVPMDQPQVSLEMLRRWMHGQLSKP
nr:serine carboxypeptidase-like [Ipomoea batatas]